VERSLYQDWRVGKRCLLRGSAPARERRLDDIPRAASHRRWPSVRLGSGQVRHAISFSAPMVHFNVERRELDAALGRGAEAAGAILLRDARAVRIARGNEGWTVSVEGRDARPS